MNHLIQDLRDRLTTWETVAGAFLVLLAVFNYYYPQYLGSITTSILMLFFGFRWLLSNKYRARAKDEEITDRYRRRLGGHVWPLLFILPALLLSAPAGIQDTRCDPCKPSAVAERFIQRWEGYSPVVYRDAAGHWTIGWGSLLTGDEYEQYKRRTLTPDEADELFREDLAYHARAVNHLVKVPLYQWQYDAIASWTFNLGTGNLSKSTLLSRVNAERHDDVPHEIRRWTRAGGRELRGLILRRNAEANLYSIL